MLLAFSHAEHLATEHGCVMLSFHLIREERFQRRTHTARARAKQRLRHPVIKCAASRLSAFRFGWMQLFGCVFCKPVVAAHLAIRFFKPEASRIACELVGILHPNGGFKIQRVRGTNKQKKPAPPALALTPKPQSPLRGDSLPNYPDILRDLSSSVPQTEDRDIEIYICHALILHPLPGSRPQLQLRANLLTLCCAKQTSAGRVSLMGR